MGLANSFRDSSTTTNQVLQDEYAVVRAVYDQLDTIKALVAQPEPVPPTVIPTTNVVVDSVAMAKAEDVVAHQLIQTRAYHANSAKGGATYIVLSLAEIRSALNDATWHVDEQIHHTCDNGLVLFFHHTQLHLAQAGLVMDGVTNESALFDGVLGRYFDLIASPDDVLVLHEKHTLPPHTSLDMHGGSIRLDTLFLGGQQITIRRCHFVALPIWTDFYYGLLYGNHADVSGLLIERNRFDVSTRENNAIVLVFTETALDAQIDGIMIRDNEFIDCGRMGVELVDHYDHQVGYENAPNRVRNIQVLNNVFRATGSYYVPPESTPYAEGGPPPCSYEYNGMGVSLSGKFNACTVRDNHFYNCVYSCIESVGASDCNYDGNYFYQGNGTAFSFSGRPAKGISVTNNTCVFPMEGDKYNVGLRIHDVQQMSLMNNQWLLNMKVDVRNAHYIYFTNDRFDIREKLLMLFEADCAHNRLFNCTVNNLRETQTWVFFRTKDGANKGSGDPELLPRDNKVVNCDLRRAANSGAFADVETPAWRLGTEKWDGSLYTEADLDQAELFEVVTTW